MMERETKIGLLVGLSFIIAVGILLSDHLSTANEPRPAQLQATGGVVRGALGEVSTADPDMVATAAPVVRVPQAIAPAQPLVTANELSARRAAAAAAAAAAADPLPPVAMATKPYVVEPVPSAVASKLSEIAARHGQEIVPADAGVEPAPAARTVVGRPGDTLGSLAERAFGSNTRATRSALVSANASLKADPSRIVAGHAYSVGGSAEARATAKSTAKSTDAAGSTAVTWYTVQPGDTLWSIAGNARAVKAIRDLNRDALAGGDRVHPRMRLRVPKKAAD